MRLVRFLVLVAWAGSSWAFEAVFFPNDADADPQLEVYAQGIVVRNLHDRQTGKDSGYYFLRVDIATGSVKGGV